MDQELLVRQIMQEVMKNMQGSAAACECESKVTVEDYPLGEKKPELIKSASGKSLNDLTLQGVIDGKLDAKDFRITKETLELQAQVAESAVTSHTGCVSRNASCQSIQLESLCSPLVRIIKSGSGKSFVSR